LLKLNDNICFGRDGNTMHLIERWLARALVTFRKPNEVASGRAPLTSNVICESQEDDVSPAPTAVIVDAPHDNETTDAIVLTAPDQQEIDRRRDLVRGWFNEFWKGRDDKPTSFVDRLNEAESYINKRLTASGEGWQLDTEARTILCLPARTTSHGT
jgi:hypothetical protein